jgi:hypothetical protein
MADGKDGVYEGEEGPEQGTGGPFPDTAGERPTLNDFRRRVNAFWGDPATAQLSQGLRPGREAESITPTRALEAHLGDSLAILASSMPDEADFRLQKSLTLRDGRIVSISGDEQPLPDDDRILVVTSTTTVLGSNSFAAETNVLVFERETGR